MNKNIPTVQYMINNKELQYITIIHYLTIDTAVYITWVTVCPVFQFPHKATCILPQALATHLEQPNVRNFFVTQMQVPMQLLASSENWSERAWPEPGR